MESKRKIGVTNGQWRKWMLQLTIFLQHQVRHTNLTLVPISFNMSVNNSLVERVDRRWSSRLEKQP